MLNNLSDTYLLKKVYSKFYLVFFSIHDFQTLFLKSIFGQPWRQLKIDFEFQIDVGHRYQRHRETLD